MNSSRFQLDIEVGLIRQKLLHFAAGFNKCVVLDSHSDSSTLIPVTGIKYDLIIAAGAIRSFSAENNCLGQLQEFIDQARLSGSWVFGHLGYDLKNEIEELESRHDDYIGFPVVGFFEPEHLVIIKGDQVTVSTQADPEVLWNEILKISVPSDKKTDSLVLQPRMTRTEYTSAVTKALRHIHLGDVYELNMCHEFFAENVMADPIAIAAKLFKISPNPFSCYYRDDNTHLICASPERFMMRNGNKLVSQPIKGTAARSSDIDVDTELKNKLAEDPKERSENVMIVDLVRNDLSRVAQKASVKVEELFGVYTFPGVHQMISTISCLVNDEVSFTDIIRATFPMGSMTGAPKIRAMQIIDDLEHSRRGLFSGSVGYIEPNGDFDFNVVIRNIQYNNNTRYLSVMAGGAITAASHPGKEYDETIVKLSPQFRALGAPLPTEQTAFHD